MTSEQLFKSVQNPSDLRSQMQEAYANARAASNSHGMDWAGDGLLSKFSDALFSDTVLPELLEKAANRMGNALTFRKETKVQYGSLPWRAVFDVLIRVGKTDPVSVGVFDVQTLKQYALSEICADVVQRILSNARLFNATGNSRRTGLYRPAGVGFARDPSIARTMAKLGDGQAASQQSATAMRANHAGF